MTANIREPNWLEMTIIGSEFDQEIDLNARAEAPDTLRFRHRERTFTGEAIKPWKPGPAPERLTRSQDRTAAQSS